MIRGTAVNANGRTGGITRPSATGQEDVIRRAYENAGLPFSDTAFFECHGTGTQAGDPLEVTAVGNVFASSRSDALADRLLIGSIKPSLGHTEGASAIASIMKVVLSLEAGQIPPTHGVKELNPNIDFEKAKVEVVRDSTMSWPDSKLRRVSVNSFGFGGANGHCIIDHVNVVLPNYVKPGVIIGTDHSVNGNGHSNGNGSSNGNEAHISPPKHWPIISPQKKTSRADAGTRQLVLLPFSAHNLSSLKLNIEALGKVVTQWPLADIAYTLGCKRSRLQQRSFRIVDKENIAGALDEENAVFTSPIRTSNVGYVFTGQGAQWAAMGAQLFEYDVFRTAIDYLDYVLLQLPSPPTWTIYDTLSGLCEPDHIQSPQVSQVACTAVQIGLVDLLASWSVHPTAVVGHSSGEMAAAYAAGRLTASETITVAYFRGQSVRKNKAKGAMLAAGMAADQASGYLGDMEDQIKLAAINSPGSVTLSGDADAIETLSITLTKDGVFNRILRTGGNAYHSHHMKAIGSDFSTSLSDGLEHIKKLGLVDSGQLYNPIPWVSSVTPEKVISYEGTTPSYWRANLESPVRFNQAIEGMMSLENGTPIDVLVEIGPHSALKGPIDQTLKSIKSTARYVSTLTRNEDGRVSMLKLAGALFCLNAEIDIVAVNAVDASVKGGKRSLQHGCTAVGFPTYQYTYGPVMYYESRASKEYRLREVIKHDLIGSSVPGAGKFHPQWRNVLRVKDLPWLSDHRLIPDAVFPGAGFIAMAVEAVFRAHHSSPNPQVITGYSLRKVDIEAALRIPEDDNGIEIIISLDNVSTATTRSSSWVRFVVSSVAQDSDEWTQHCTGLVKVETGQPISKRKIKDDMDARYPDLSSWYAKFEEIGIGYGPAFQPLSELHIDPHRHIAKASVSLNPTAGLVEGGESSYAIHPAALDATFQLGLIACYGGRTEKATAAFVPVHLSQVYIKAGINKDHAVAVASGRIQGLRNAYVQLQMLDNTGEVVLNIDRLRLTRFKESTGPVQSKKPFTSPFTRLVWKPDIRTLNNCQMRKLFPAPAENTDCVVHLERADMIACLIVADIYEMFVRGGNGPQPKGELSHWVSWVRRCVEEDQRTNMVKARELSTEERHQMLQMLYMEAGDRTETIAAKCLHENMSEILNERKTGIDVLVNAGVLTSLYENGHLIAGSHPQLFNVLDCLGHVNPNMRILEIGAGTGAATRVAMRALAGPNGIKRYADYTFTDISAGFLGLAREFMSDYRDINYSVLDIEKDPLANGYEPVYDVVIACEAIHATASMDRTLAHCRSLLKPGGKLVLAETTRMRVLLGLLYGTLTGYWLGVSDGRTEGPFMDQQTWETRLRRSGFSGNEIILDDYPQPHDSTSVLVSTRLEEPAVEVNGDRLDQDNTVIHLLHGTTGATTLMVQVADELRRRGATPITCRVDEAPETVPAGAHVVVFLGYNNDLFDGNETRLRAYQHLARHTNSMVWLTTSAMVKGRDPRGAFMIGLLRAIATENPAGRFLSIDVDTSDHEATESDLVQSIVDHEFALRHERSAKQSQDRELAWQDGCMWVSRLVPDAELGVYTEPVKTPTYLGAEMQLINSRGPVRADFETPGVLASLYFRPYTEMLQPLPAGYIDVKVAAVGVNWKDLALASGRFDGVSNDLSSEYAGVVIRTGSAVVGLSIGDRVYGVGRGHFGNYTRVPAAFAQRLQPEDDLAEVATMPLVYMTALFALGHVAHIRQGQKILIQSATGGLGLAAIQLARYKGAEIFATVGSANKVSFLVDTMGIESDHIIPSRDAVALSRAAESTGKGGFDIIISTVAGGNLLSESLEALRPTGHLIDLARVDVLESKGIGLELFQKTASFSSFDLNSVIDADPELGRQLMKQVDRLYREGHITPIRPSSVFKVSMLDQCLQSFSKGEHIGKLVVSFQDSDSLVKMVKQPPAAVFDPKARYIITGGLGGLGRSIIRWMSDRGAQDFVILSRRGANTPAARLLVDDLAARGIEIETVACDVGKKEEVIHAIEKATTADRPVKGVIHAALSLSDLSFDKLTIDQWQSGIAAKTAGTLNLHEATLSLPLEFFVMITSTESVWAPPTQSSYIAATNFQEYFARHRRQLGLPASTVAYGLVTDVRSDFKAGSVGTADMYARNKVLTTTEWQVLATLEPAFLSAPPARWLSARNDPLSEANFFTCLDPAALAALPSTNVPRWHGDGRVSLILRAMNDAQKHAKDNVDGGVSDVSASASSPARLRHDFEEGVKAGPDARASTVELVTEGIRRTIAEMLFLDILSVNPDKSIAEQGVDSLVAAELRHWFLQALGTNLHMLDLLDAQVSIRSLAESIVDKALRG
ncbi:polyketide synthase dehydratase-domain-containing protein [Biscogniauxia mediterranea]|nr:polyketide synthase dehydratase-domain-containing protein [Biscogniauxia mediterranea]